MFDQEFLCKLSETVWFKSAFRKIIWFFEQGEDDYTKYPKTELYRIFNEKFERLEDELIVIPNDEIKSLFSRLLLENAVIGVFGYFAGLSKKEVDFYSFMTQT